MAASVLLTIGHQPALVEKIVALSKAIKPGNRSGEMGPVIDKASLDKIERYISQAEKLDAEILVDGRLWKGKEGTHEGGWWTGPTVILHKCKDDPAMKVNPPLVPQRLNALGGNIWSSTVDIGSRIKRRSNRN